MGDVHARLRPRPRGEPGAVEPDARVGGSEHVLRADHALRRSDRDLGSRAVDRRNVAAVICGVGWRVLLGILPSLLEGDALRFEEVVAILVQLLVEGCLLVDHRIELIELVLDRGDLSLPLGEGRGESIGRPIRFLSGIRRRAGDLGVAFGDGTHELQPVRELCDALGAEEPVDLRTGPDVGLHRSRRQS